jgi:hypothetical protein
VGSEGQRSVREKISRRIELSKLSPELRASMSSIERLHQVRRCIFVKEEEGAATECNNTRTDPGSPDPGSREN